jgi:hypothetical protein
MLHHPGDGIQLRNFDRKHKDFAAEVRNIRFGLSTDGMNPLERQTTHIVHDLSLYISINLHIGFV